MHEIMYPIWGQSRTGHRLKIDTGKTDAKFRKLKKEKNKIVM